MLRILAIAAALAMTGGTAHAAGEGACVPLEGVKAKLSAIHGVKFEPLSVGQIHFTQGAYAVIPPFTGLPKADGAVMFVMPNHSAIVIWTRGGKLACDHTDVEAKIVALIEAVHTGKLEEAPISAPVEEPKAEDSADCIKRNPDACSF
jgi:hypothetical protein